MKYRATKLNVLLLFIVIFWQAEAQVNSLNLVELHGRQFVDQNGDPFFPLLVNWSCLVQDGGNNDFWPSPYHSYGPGISFECNNSVDCYQQILNQFMYIKSLGFNGIRLAGLYPLFIKHTNNSISMELLTYDQNVNPSIPLEVITPTGQLGLGFNALSDCYNILLDAAANVPQPFYIILNTGGQSNRDDLNNVVFDWGVVQPLYLVFLEELADRLKNKQALMAYDLYNEPCYHIRPDPFLNKYEACNLVSEWVSAIKVNDQNRLVTIGNCWDETIQFDPSCLKIDFNSPHFYPAPSFHGSTIETSQSDYENQIKGILFWLGKNMPVPWLVGETGFTAIDNHPSNPTWSTNLNGTETEQDDFARLILPLARDCGASGFSWWNFQDTHDNSDISKARGLNFWGLLKRDITSCPDPLNPCSLMNKPVTGYFTSYASIQNPYVNPSNCQQPVNYFDPFNHEYWNSGAVGEITGLVEDQDGNPIAGALIYAWAWIDEEMNPNGDIDNIHYPFYTFTNSDPNNNQLAIGEFKLRPYNYKYPNETNKQKITSIWITGIGIENRQIGGWGNTALSQTSFNESLRRIHFGYSGIAQNQVVDLEQRNLRGGESLLVQNLLVSGTGTADVTARKSVLLQNSHAEVGSLVHIYLSPYDKCVSYDGLRVFHPFSGSEVFNDQFAIMDRSISLVINTLKDIVLRPIPADEHILIQLIGFEKQTEIKVYTALGVEVLSFLDVQGEVKISTIDLANGLYILKANDGYEQISEKFLVTH